MISAPERPDKSLEMRTLVVNLPSQELSHEHKQDPPHTERENKKIGLQDRNQENDNTRAKENEQKSKKKKKRRDRNTQNISSTTENEQVMSVTGEMEETMSDKRTITNLSHLSGISKDEFPEIFEHSLSTVFQYAEKDIVQCINKRGMETLGLLHKRLSKAVVQLFPTLAERRVVKRSAKHKCISDIIEMGMTLVNKTMSKDIEKIFVEQGKTNLVVGEAVSASCQNFCSAEIVQTVADLATRLKVVENELNTLKSQTKRTPQAHEAIVTPLDQAGGLKKTMATELI